MPRCVSSIALLGLPGHGIRHSLGGRNFRGERSARARVVYCETLSNTTFALGLEFLARTDAFGACDLNPEPL